MKISSSTMILIVKTSSIQLCKMTSMLPEGGTYLQGFRNAITKTFNDYARPANLLKDSERCLYREVCPLGPDCPLSVSK